MKDALLFAGILVAWIVLNRWVLPYFGVQTCMTGHCSRPLTMEQSRPEQPGPTLGETSHKAPDSQSSEILL